MTTPPNSGTTRGFATIPTSESWWKWNAVSGTVPSMAQGDTRAAATSRTRHRVSRPAPAGSCGANRRVPTTIASTEAKESW